MNLTALTPAFLAWLAAALISLSGRESMLARASLFAGSACPYSKLRKSKKSWRFSGI
ncbi:MAG: hypothetical protein ABSF41_11130 [Pseudolabrys sp.]|jgi:hypothetical protein